jgi:hypothetical protein
MMTLQGQNYDTLQNSARTVYERNKKLHLQNCPSELKKLAIKQGTKIYYQAYIKLYK